MKLTKNIITLVLLFLSFVEIQSQEGLPIYSDYLTDNYEEYKYDERELDFNNDTDRELINTLLLVAALGNEKSDFKLSYIQASRIYELYKYIDRLKKNNLEEEYNKINDYKLRQTRPDYWQMAVKRYT